MIRLATLVASAMLIAGPGPALAQMPPRGVQTIPSPSTTMPPGAADQYQTEAQAKARCGSNPVVWMNTSSKIYHLPGTRDYGKTKAGAYMCKPEADKLGRAAKNEK